MIWLIVAALQAAPAELCSPPLKLADVTLIGRTGKNHWTYGIGKKISDEPMLTMVSCAVDDRQLTDILNNYDRVMGRGAIDLNADRSLPERVGCAEHIGYIERNTNGGYKAEVFGRLNRVVARLTIDTDEHDNRAGLVRVLEQFRTRLLGCLASTTKNP